MGKDPVFKYEFLVLFIYPWMRMNMRTIISIDMRRTLKHTQRLKGRVKMTMTQEIAVRSQPQRPMPVSTSSPDTDVGNVECRYRSR